MPLTTLTMRSRRLSLRLERQPGVHADASIYAAYAGVSFNASASPSESMWWDEDKIEATVNRHFVLSHLLPGEQKRIDEALGFGDGLTDDTYMDWIDQKAKRIFLILVELGVPDQIFGVIDDSWDDDDLPIPADQVARLKLTYDRDPKFERRFYERQFEYLLRHLQYGDCLFYEDEEVVPLELVDKRPVVGLPHSNTDKVYLANKPDNIMLRRKIPLGLGVGQMPQEEFVAGITQKRAAEHKHLVTVWASYVHQNIGYILLTPVNDGTLKSFLTVIPPSIKILAKKDRRVLFLNWLDCLASALAFLHSQGLAHRKIKPSNVMMDIDNHIFLNDSGLLTNHQATDSKKSFDKESYDYAAPEQWGERPISSPTKIPQQLSRVRSQVRNAPPPSLNRASMFPDNSSTSQSSQSSQSSSMSPTSPTTSSMMSSAPSSIFSTGTTMSSMSYETESMYTVPFHPSRPDPRKSDIFSLGCVMLDILTAFLKRPSRSFTSHRSAKNKTPGRGGGLPDSSFHKNLSQVEIWISNLAKEASKKEDRLFRGVSHICNLIMRMLSPNPWERPDAQAVRDRMNEILKRVCVVDEICCEGVTSHTSHTSHIHHTKAMYRSLPNRLREADMVVILEGEDPEGRQPSDSTNSDERLSDGAENASNANSTRPLTQDMKRGMNSGAGISKLKPKPKAWQAPVYAG